MGKNLIDELIGWYGMVAIMIAFAAVSFEFLAATSVWYQILNSTGALGIAYISLKKRAYQPGVLNIIWAAIAFVAFVALVRMFA